MSDDVLHEEETGEYVFDCGKCGAEVRTESRVEVVQYAADPGKTCPECENDDQ